MIHADSHPIHEIIEIGEEARMTKDKRAENFQRAYFGSKPIKVVEPDRLLKKVLVGFVVALSVIVFSWFIVLPLFVRDAKAVMEFWK